MNARTTESTKCRQASFEYVPQKCTSHIKKIVRLAEAQAPENMKTATTCNAFTIDVFTQIDLC